MLTLSSRAELTLAEARARLRPPASRPGSALVALAAAALAATSALALAAAVILGPPAPMAAAAPFSLVAQAR